MENHDKFFYVSHIIRPEVPKEGFDMLFFYTKRDGKYYWGLGNNSFDEDYIKNLEGHDKVIRLQKPLKIERDKKTLWVDSEGKVYIDNIKNPVIDKNRALEGILLK